MKGKEFVVLDDGKEACLSFWGVPAITGPWDFKKFVKINDELIIGIRTVKYDNATLELWNGKGKHIGKGGIVIIEKPQIKPSTQRTQVGCS